MAALKPKSQTKSVSNATRRGNLAERPLESLIFHIYKKKLDAELKLTQEGVSRQLFFVGGKLCFYHASLSSENFPQYLKDQGLVSDDVFKNMMEKDPQGQPQGLHLFQVGNSQVVNLPMHLKNFLMLRGKDCFRTQTGEFGLLGGSNYFKQWSQEGVDPIIIVSRGIRSYHEMEFLAKKFEHLQERRLICSPDFQALFSKLELTPPEMNLLKRINGKETITKLAISEDIDLLSSLRLIWTLFSLRMVGMVQTAETKKTKEENAASTKMPVEIPVSKPVGPAVTSKQIRKEIQKKMQTYLQDDLFKILGVEKKSTPADVRKAYFALAKRFHPDVLSSLGLNDLTDKAGAIFAKMTHAHETLTHTEKRKEYEASLEVDPNVMAQINNIVQAEMEFQKGEIMLRNRSYPSALKQFRAAMELNPEEAEHHVYLGWSTFLNNKTDKTQAAKEAKKLIHQGLSMRENIDMGHVFLGRIAKAIGDTNESKRCFLKAIDINPENDQANAELRLINRKK